MQKKLKENNLLLLLKKNMEDIFKKEGKLCKKENLSYKAKMLSCININKSKPALYKSILKIKMFRRKIIKIYN